MPAKKELSLKEMETVSGGTGKDKRYIIYTIVKGDTLNKIAHHYHVTADDLAYWNNITDRNLIYVGQKLRIYQ